MPIVEITIPNLPFLKRALRDYTKISEPIMQRAVQASGDTLAKYTVRPTVPFKTGRLLQSFTAQYARLQARWQPNVRYAIFVHEGTKPHIILPVNKKALYWKGAAHPVRKVNHPGGRANPFMKNIAEKAQPDIAKQFQQAGNMIATEIAKRTNQT